MPARLARGAAMSAGYFPRLLRNIDIRYRLITSFILVSLIPLVISGVIFYLESSKAIQEKTRIFATEVVKQVSQNIQLQMDRVASSGDELALSESLQSALARIYVDDERDAVTALASIPKLLLAHYGSFEYVNQKYILDRKLRILDAQVFPELGKSVSSFVENAPDTKGLPYWSVYSTWAGQKSIVMLREINFKGSVQRAGTLFIGLKQSHFSRIFDAVDLGNGASVFVLDVNDGNIIIRPNDAARTVGTDFADTALTGGIERMLGRGDNRRFFSYQDRGGNQYLAAFAPIPHTTWAVVSSIPLHALIAEVRAIRNKIILIGLICFVFILLLSYCISRSISVPLDKLVDIMKETETGNYRIRMEYEGNDEIAVLSRKFNEMASKVHQHNERLEESVLARTRELKEANRKLEELSSTDGLTGLANRRRFDEVLLTELRRAIRSGKYIALIMLDVDFFKKYNDCYGHQAGDECLRVVARTLQLGCHRGGDLVARYGGEEFVLIAADTDMGGAAVLAETLRSSIEMLMLPHSESEFGQITISVGVAAVRPTPEQTTDQLLQMADRAMYRAKSQGRNRVVLMDQDGANG
jgi:diguanylate cyclase (GGDEF)-like protein